MVGRAHAERRQGHGPGDHDRPLVPRDADLHLVTDLLAQLAQSHRAQLDLTGAGHRLAAGGGRLHRAELSLQAEGRDDLAVHGQLGEGELRPRGHSRLVLEQFLHGPGSETPVAGLSLDDQVPVPAVPGRMGGQPGEAGVEHDRRHHRGDSRDRADERGAHRDGPDPGSGLEHVAGADDRGGRQPRRGRRAGHGRGAGAWPAGARPDRAQGHHGQQTEQGHEQDGRTSAQDEPVGADPAVRVIPAHWPHRGERRGGHRDGYGQGHAAQDGNQPGPGRGRRGLAAGGAQGAQHRDVRRGAIDHLDETLSDQHQQGERGDGAEQAQRDRLRHDGLLDLVVDDVGAVDGEHGTDFFLAGRLLLPVLDAGRQRGKLPLQVRDSSRASGQAQPDPRVVVRGQQLPGRPGRQDGPL